MTIIEQARAWLARIQDRGYEKSQWVDADPRKVAALCRALIARDEALAALTKHRAHRSPGCVVCDAARRALTDDGIPREG